MQFLKTLFWVALAIILALFARANWSAVTIRLWGGLEADVKLPVLVLVSFLIGFLPLFILHRVRLWGLKRRMEGLERQSVAVQNVPPAAPVAPPPEPARPAGEDRIATDAKAWPTS